MKQSHTKQSRATQDPFCNVTTEAAQLYSFHFIFKIILLHLHSSFCYKIHIYATRYTMHKPNQCTIVHSLRTQWFTTGLREFRASRKFPGFFPKRRFGAYADHPLACRATRLFKCTWPSYSTTCLPFTLNIHGPGSDVLQRTPTTQEKNPHGLESHIILFDKTVPQWPLIPYG